MILLAMFALAGIYLVLIGLKYKLILYSNAIESRNLIIVRRLLRDDLAGYRIVLRGVPARVRAPLTALDRNV